MVKKIDNKWVAECTQCGWAGEAESKEAARELLHRHLDIHRTPTPVSDSDESDKVTSPPSAWPDLKDPRSDPING